MYVLMFFFIGLAFFATDPFSLRKKMIFWVTGIVFYLLSATIGLLVFVGHVDESDKQSAAVILQADAVLSGWSKAVPLHNLTVFQLLSARFRVKSRIENAESIQRELNFIYKTNTEVSISSIVNLKKLQEGI